MQNLGYYLFPKHYENHCNYHQSQHSCHHNYGCHDLRFHLMVWDVFDNVVAADRLGFKVPPDLRLVLRSQQREIVRMSSYNFQMLETTFNYVQ